MKITDIAEQKLTESEEGVYIGFIDEKHVGMHVIERWVATTDGMEATKQAEQMAEDAYDDVVVLKFRPGKAGFNAHHRAKQGRNVYKELGKDIDGDEDYPMSDNMDQLSKQGR